MFEPSALRELDQRTRLGRRVAQRFNALVDDLGGQVGLSTQQSLLVERACWLAERLAAMEKAFAQGESTDFNAYVGGINSLGALLARLGLRRQMRVVDLDLEDYIEHRYCK